MCELWRRILRNLISKANTGKEAQSGPCTALHCPPPAIPYPKGHDAEFVLVVLLLIFSSYRWIKKWNIFTEKCTGDGSVTSDQLKKQNESVAPRGP